MIIPFPVDRATGRDARITRHLKAARYCQGKAALMESYGDQWAAAHFTRQAQDHMDCVPAGQVVELGQRRRG